MCLILFAKDIHPQYPFILAANRDEFYSRPTKPLAYWEDAPSILAGRDLKNRGTWLGISRTGSLAAVTNFRDPASVKPDAPSRGNLVKEFLQQNEPPDQYLRRIRNTAGTYNGFNLLVGRGTELYHFSNRSMEISKIGPGLYGLSNDLLDSPWPKIIRGKQMLSKLLGKRREIDPMDIFKILEDRIYAPDYALPDTGVGNVWERILSPIFIAGKIYGTRCSSIILVEKNQRTTFYERTFDHLDGEPVERETVEYVLNRDS